MYMILNWVNDDYVTAITNINGSIRLFEKLTEADGYADGQGNKDNLRVISIEGVE